MPWHAKPVEGQTLNAVVFGSVIDHLGLGSAFARHALLAAVLAFEAGLLLVGAQTGFLDGPAVLSNMAGDSWVPRHFRDLSARLVRQNGIVVMGVSSLAILMWTHGSVDILVVLYSINVFLTFSLSLLGLCIYWWKHRHEGGDWVRHFVLSALGLSVTSTVLVITLIEKFTEGGWLTVLVTSAVIALCFLIKRHYSDTRAQLAKEDALFAGEPPDSRTAFGTHPVIEFMKLADSTMGEFPNSVCFASKLIFKRVNFLTAWLHNQTPVEIQTRLHQQGRQMVLLPMNVG